MKFVKKIVSKIPSEAKLTLCITMIVLAILTVIATEVQAEAFIGSQEVSGSTYNYPGTKAMGMVVEVTGPVNINGRSAVHVTGAFGRNASGGAFFLLSG